MSQPSPIQIESSAVPTAIAGAAPTSFHDPLAGPAGVPVDATARAHNASMVVLAVLASMFALHWAAAVVVPLLLGLMLSYALTPLVNRMARTGLPRTLAAALLLAGIVGGIGSAAYALSDDAAALIEGLPSAAQKLRRGVEGQRSHRTADTIDKVQKAATELERAAGQSASTGPAPGSDVTKVQIEKARFNVKDYLWPSALGLGTFSVEAIVVLFVSFFLLSSSDTFRRKMVKIAGPTFGRRKLTLQALDEIDGQIQRYLLVQIFTSAVVGVATWLAFLGLGVEHSAVWGIVSFAFNFIPYLGSMAVAGSSALMGFVQFGAFEMALATGGAVLAIHSIEGYLLTPMLTSRANRMNPVAVFVGVLAWGWLLGPWGLFLGVPILTAIKAVCDRVDGFKPVGELLGN